MEALLPLFHLLSPAGAMARLSILIFHRVLTRPDPLFPGEMDAARFSTVCGWLASWFNVLPLDKAVALIKEGKLPARAACITFDDGYADNHDVALPILKHHGLPATFFIATGFLDGGRMWNDSIIESVRRSRVPKLDLSSIDAGTFPLVSVEDKRATIGALIRRAKYLPLNQRVVFAESLGPLAGAHLPADLMMTSANIKALRYAGMSIGGHTVSHPILATLNNDEARDEIQAGKKFLEQLLGERIGLFAYPNGKPGEDYSPATVELVRSLGFDAAVSTQPGSSRHGDDLLQIKRFTPWDQGKQRFGARLLANLVKA